MNNEQGMTNEEVFLGRQKNEDRRIGKEYVNREQGMTNEEVGTE